MMSSYSFTFVFQDEWDNLQFRDCNGQSNGIDLPEAVINLENSFGAIAGEGLGAERTFDFSQVGEGLFGPGGNQGEKH